MNAPLIFTLSLFMSFTLVPFLMRHAGALGLMDRSDNQRKIHEGIIPRSGGLAIALSVLLPLFYLLQDTSYALGLLLASVVIVIFGIIDDRHELEYRWKIVGQSIAITIFLIGLPDLPKMPFYLDSTPAWLTYFVLFLFLLGTTNAVNLSDGLDGLAAGTTLLSLGLIAYLGYEAEINFIFVMALAVMGSLLGFLRYNTHPAKVFMGDTGSQFIGFISATLAISVTQHANSAASPMLPIIILGLPILDTLMVMAIRMRQGKPPFSPDKNHIHHQLMKLGFHHYEAVATIYILQILLIVAGFSFRHLPDMFLLTCYLAFASTLVYLIYLGRIKNWLLHPEPLNNDYTEKRNPYFRRLDWLYQHNPIIISISIVFTWVVLLLSVNNIQNNISNLALTCLIVVISICLILRKLSHINTRIMAYSASVLVLYPYCTTTQTISTSGFLILLLACMGIFLALAIRITRKEQFQLDNLDILILFILLATPMLPINLPEKMDFATMLVSLGLMLYAVEFLINKSKNQLLILNISAACILTILSIGF